MRNCFNRESNSGEEVGWKVGSAPGEGNISLDRGDDLHRSSNAYHVFGALGWWRGYGSGRLGA